MTIEIMKYWNTTYAPGSMEATARDVGRRRHGIGVPCTPRGPGEGTTSTQAGDRTGGFSSRTETTRSPLPRAHDACR